jgi:hypothetical protein
MQTIRLMMLRLRIREYEAVYFGHEPLNDYAKLTNGGIILD